MRIRSGLRHPWFALLFAAALLCGCPSDDDDSAGDDDVDACPWDENDDASAATELSEATPYEGYICPMQDQDWYRFDAGGNLVTVSLTVDAPVSPIDLTYTLWDAPAAEILGSPSASESAASTGGLEIIHGVPNGEMLVVVRDRGDDAMDERHPYILTLTSATDADVHEPNNDQGAATTAGGTLQGYISYRGDEDWYAVDAPDRGLIEVTLTMPAGGIEPAFRILDPTEAELVSLSEPAGTQQDTLLSTLQSVDDAATYYVVVSDDDKTEVDPDNPYTLALVVQQDPDTNEPNDSPAEATGLADESCGSVWSSWASETAYLASPGDTDWYRMDLSGCGSGVMEVDVQFSNPGSLPEEMSAFVRVVREAGNSPCKLDQDCQTLQMTCDESMDCSTYGNLCLTASGGVCAGAGVCLPTGYCGATMLSETAAEASPGSVHLAVPTMGLDPMYIAVADYQGDAYSLTHQYTAEARVRTDPDTHEPSETYTGGPPADTNAGYHVPLATSVPVHDCRPPKYADCCGPSDWVRGYLSYSYDQDWYEYDHPCPGEDCMVVIHYDLDGGPVDFYFRVLAGYGGYSDNITSTVDLANQADNQGSFGGLGAMDECFYAYQGHSNPYRIPIRDTIFQQGDPEGGTWDFSAGQAYAFCVELLADGCSEPPCFLYKNGCGQP